MSFMQPEVCKGTFYRAETKHGETYVFPADVIGKAGLRQEGYRNIETVHGFGCRMSAPGYLDATEWVVAESEREAYEELLAMYGTDEGPREPWELEVISIVLAHVTPDERPAMCESYGVTIDPETADVIDLSAESESA